MARRLASVIVVATILILPPCPTFAQSVPSEPPSTCVDHCGGAAVGSPTSRPAPPSSSAFVVPNASKEAAAAAAAREALDLNEQAIAAAKRGDWNVAVNLLEKAASKTPDDPGIRNNLTTARNAVAAAKSRAAATAVGESLVDLARSLTAASPPTTSGLDFRSDTANSAGGTNSAELAFTSSLASGTSTGTASTLQFGNVVDTRNVPSGLPRAIDDAIAGAYRDAPPGVIDRVRKGFQAVMTRDWEVARAWFSDALNRDPTNAGLKSLIDAVGLSEAERRQLLADLERSIDDLYWSRHKGTLEMLNELLQEQGR